jgi:hypothetical protein
MFPHVGIVSYDLVKFALIIIICFLLYKKNYKIAMHMKPEFNSQISDLFGIANCVNVKHWANLQYKLYVLICDILLLQTSVVLPVLPWFAGLYVALIS